MIGNDPSIRYTLIGFFRLCIICNRLFLSAHLQYKYRRNSLRKFSSGNIFLTRISCLSKINLKMKNLLVGICLLLTVVSKILVIIEFGISIYLKFKTSQFGISLPCFSLIWRIPLWIFISFPFALIQTSSTFNFISFPFFHSQPYKDDYMHVHVHDRSLHG